MFKILKLFVSYSLNDIWNLSFILTDLHLNSLSHRKSFNNWNINIWTRKNNWTNKLLKQRFICSIIIACSISMSYSEKYNCDSLLNHLYWQIPNLWIVCHLHVFGRRNTVNCPRRTPNPVFLRSAVFLSCSVAQLLAPTLIPQNAPFPNVIMTLEFRKLPMFGLGWKRCHLWFALRGNGHI